MQGLVLLMVFFGTAMLVLGTYAFMNRRRLAAARALRQRMGDNSPLPAGPTNILREEHRSSVRPLDRLLRSLSASAAIEDELRRAGVGWSPGEFLLGSALAAALFVLIGQQSGTISAWLGALAGVAAPFVLVRYLKKQRRKKF